jgi:hypothetical protein
MNSVEEREREREKQRRERAVSSLPVYIKAAQAKRYHYVLE